MRTTRCLTGNASQASRTFAGLCRMNVRCSFHRVGHALRGEQRLGLFHSSTRIVIVALLCIITLPGCAGMKGFGNRHTIDTMASVPKPRWADDPQVEEVVDHLNRNVDKLQAWRANSVKIRAKVDNIYVPLKGTLAVERGRHLRLVVDSLVGNEVDIGSNDERFWIWAKRMPPPQYVFCRHEQMDDVRQSMGIPFEPEWLMQALGVAPLSAVGMKLEIEPTARQARLVQQITSAHGKPLRKVILVDLPRGVILEHSVYDYHGQRVAVAKLEDHQHDKASGVVLPRRVKLDCPQSDLSLVMNLGPVEINPRGIPSQIWDMPKLSGYQMVDLGATIRPGTRIAAGLGPDFKSKLGSERIADVSLDREAGSLHGAGDSPIQFLAPDFGDIEGDDPDDTTGRVKLSNEEGLSEESFEQPASSEEPSEESPFQRAPRSNNPPIRQISNPAKRPIPRDWWADN